MNFTGFDDRMDSHSFDLPQLFSDAEQELALSSLYPLEEDQVYPESHAPPLAEDPAALWRMFSPESLVQERSFAVQLARSQAEQAVASGSIKCAAVIIEDTLDLPVKQRSPFSLSCQLFVPPGAAARVLGEAEVQVVAPHLKKTDGVLREHRALVENGVVHFPRVSMTTGSRLKEIHFRVSCLVEVDGEQMRVVSDLTRPTVMLTNEKQWSTGLGRLVRAKLFADDAKEVPWIVLVKELQRCWLEATRQQLDDVKRPLRFEDAAVMKKMFVGDTAHVSVGVFDVLFEWFGIVASRLRFGQGLNTLWCSGCVIGFVGKGDSELLLEGQADGTALLRFSQSAPNRVSLVYRKQGGVHHFLVPLKVGSSAASLGSFLVHSASIKHILGDAFPLQCEKAREICRIPISEAFLAEERAVGEEALPGYDESLK